MKAVAIALLALFVSSVASAQEIKQGSKGVVTGSFEVLIEGGQTLVRNGAGTEFYAGKDVCWIEPGGQIAMGGRALGEKHHLYYYIQEKERRKQKGKACPDRTQFLKTLEEIQALSIKWDVDKHRPNF